MSTPSTSIDELLRYEEDAPADEPSGGPASTGAKALVKALLVAVAATAVIVFGLRLAGLVVPVLLVGGSVCAVLALRHVLRLVAPPPARLARSPAGDGHLGDGTYHWPTPDAMRREVGRWEQRLSWQADSPGTFPTQLQPMLRELADERLRQRAGFTIAADPAGAAALLGEPLWTVLTGVPRRGPGQRELAQSVARLEELT